MERRVLVGELVERRRELVEIGFARWLDRYGKRRRWELDRVVKDDGILVAQCRVRGGRRELRDSADIAGAHLVGELLLLAAEIEDLPDVLVGRGSDDRHHLALAHGRM